MLAYLPVFAIRKLRRSGYEKAITQRLGRYGADLPAEPRCWIHAVSVGEAVTSVPLVEALARRWPELGIVMTTVTPTGARIVVDKLNGRVSHRYFPVDLPGPVRRALNTVRPRFFIGMETELWPNFLRALAARGIPSMVANGRISDRSFRRYRRVRFLTSRMLRDVAVFAMQSEEDARRIIALGAPPERVVVTGNLKTDLAPHLVLLLAPRHPERVPEVERLVSERGLKAVRRSDLPGARDRSAVIILDTVGELAQIYRVATVVFVGGSLVPTGGHNMLEPALLRKAVLFGPHTSNFRESADALLAAGGAALVEEGAQLERHVGLLLGDADLRRRMGEAAFHTVVGRQGAVKHTLELVERYLMEPARG